MRYTENDTNTPVICHFLFTFGHIIGTPECIEYVGVYKTRINYCSYERSYSESMDVKYPLSFPNPQTFSYIERSDANGDEFITLKSCIDRL